MKSLTPAETQRALALLDRIVKPEEVFQERQVVLAVNQAKILLGYGDPNELDKSYERKKKADRELHRLRARLQAKGYRRDPITHKFLPKQAPCQTSTP